MTPINYKKYFGITALILIFCLCVIYKQYRKNAELRSDKNRLINNADIANDTIRYYKSKTGKLVSLVSSQEYTIKELRAIYPDIVREIQDMKIKITRVEHINQTTIENKTNIETYMYDSTIYDTVPVPVQKFEYADTWNKIKGTIVNKKIKLAVESTIPITQVVYRGERVNPWLWIFSRRKLQQSIKSDNPTAKVIYSNDIQIKKR